MSVQPTSRTNPKPIGWDQFTPAQRRRAESLLVANWVFAGGSPDFRLRVAIWLATGRDGGAS